MKKRKRKGKEKGKKIERARRKKGWEEKKIYFGRNDFHFSDLKPDN